MSYLSDDLDWPTSGATAVARSTSRESDVEVKQVFDRTKMICKHDVTCFYDIMKVCV